MNDNVYKWRGEDEDPAILRGTALHTTKKQQASWQNWSTWVMALKPHDRPGNHRV